mgnify:CR=1 FL=1
MLLYLVPKFIPIILLLLIGIVIKRTNFMSELSINELKKFVVNISLPALLFFSFLNTSFQYKYIVIILIIFGLNILMLGIGRLLKILLKIDNKYFTIMFTGFEMGMLGFSLYGSVYGPENISYIGVLDLGQEIFVWFILTSILLSFQNTTINIKSSVKNFISSPVIIAIFLGIVLNICGLSDYLTKNIFLSGFISTLSMISQVTIPFILIIIGYQLNLHFSKLYLPLITIVCRICIMIILGILINSLVFNNLLHLERKFSIALFTLLILPPPFIIPLFMKYNQTELDEYVGNTLSLGTIFTIIGFFGLVIIFSL